MQTKLAMTMPVGTSTNQRFLWVIEYLFNATNVLRGDTLKVSSEQSAVGIQRQANGK